MVAARRPLGGEVDALAHAERPQASAVDIGLVDEDVVRAAPRDESEAALGVEALNGADLAFSSHSYVLL